MFGFFLNYIEFLKTKNNKKNKNKNKNIFDYYF